MKKDMKQIYIVILTALLAIGISSCGNSLGYDPNVNITRIGQVSTDTSSDTTKTSKVYQVDSVDFIGFKETLQIMQRKEDLEWVFRVLSKNIKIDTSGSAIKLWLNLSLLNPLPDQNYRNRGITDRVVKFDLIFAGTLNEQMYRLDDATANKNWLELFIKYMPNDKTKSFNGSQIRSDLVIKENNRQKGLINMYLDVGISDMNLETRVRRFTGNIIIYYKTI